MRELQNKNRDFKGIWIPANIWLDTNLTLIEKIVFIEIDSLDGEQGCYANNQHFADFCDISKGRASQIINSLKKKGYISVQIDKDENGQVVRRTMRSLFGYQLKTLSSKAKEGVSSKAKQPPIENDEYKNTSLKNTISKDISPTKVEQEEEVNITKKEIDTIIDTWNNNAKGRIKKIRAINKNTKRYRLLNARYKESSLEDILEAISHISKSSFLQGFNSRAWSIDFDWFVEAGNYIKTLEGKFDDIKEEAPTALPNVNRFTFTGEGY